MSRETGTVASGDRLSRTSSLSGSNRVRAQWISRNFRSSAQAASSGVGTSWASRHTDQDADARAEELERAGDLLAWTVGLMTSSSAPAPERVPVG